MITKEQYKSIVPIEIHEYIKSRRECVQWAYYNHRLNPFLYQDMRSAKFYADDYSSEEEDTVADGINSIRF